MLVKVLDLIKVGQVWEYRRVLSKNSKKYKQNSLLFSTDENVILIVGTNKLYFLYYLLDTEYDSPGNRVKIRNGDIDMLLAQYKLVGDCEKK